MVSANDSMYALSGFNIHPFLNYRYVPRQYLPINRIYFVILYDLLKKERDFLAQNHV